jgi:AcrR family transcriptional regulator
MLSSDNMTEPTRREKSEVRRRQIVDATLALLADCSLDQLSTRQIARALGISQPALFRHFRSRDQILLEVVESSRTDLARLAERVLGGQSDPALRLEALGRALLAHLDRHPGLPRLLFAHAAIGDSPLLRGLRQLYAMQLSLVTELVREGQAQGVFDARFDAGDAARVFAGLLQGATLMRRLEQSDEPLETRGGRMLAIWLAGVRAGPRAQSSQRRREDLVQLDGLRALDVRPLLAQGIEPLETIFRALEAVGPGGVLKVTAPFRPAPLIALLSSRGHTVNVEALDARCFSVEIVHGGRPAIEDLRDLEPPGPLERVLAATASLPPAGVYLARVPRHPRLLLPRLAERGLDWRVQEEPDGSALIRIVRPA